MGVLLSIPAELHDAMVARYAEHVAAGGEPGLDAFIERAIGSESDWEALVDADRLDVFRPPTIEAERARASSARRVGQLSTSLRCECCPGMCRNQMFWRGSRRCSCTPERIAAHPVPGGPDDPHAR